MRRENDRNVRLKLFHYPCGDGTVHSRHAVVHHNQVNGFGLEDRRASAPEEAVTTRKPADSSIIRCISRTGASSSTQRTVRPFITQPRSIGPSLGPLLNARVALPPTCRRRENPSKPIRGKELQMFVWYVPELTRS